MGKYVCRRRLGLSGQSAISRGVDEEGARIADRVLIHQGPERGLDRSGRDRGVRRDAEGDRIQAWRMTIVKSGDRLPVTHHARVYQAQAAEAGGLTIRR